MSKIRVLSPFGSIRSFGPSSLLRFASLPGLPLQHADERHRFQEALAEAHRTALDCSMEDDANATTAPTSSASPRSSGAVHFATFLHLIRSYLESIKQKQMQREEAALRWSFFVVFLRGAKSDTSQLKVFDNELRFLMTANYRNRHVCMVKNPSVTGVVDSLFIFNCLRQARRP